MDSNSFIEKLTYNGWKSHANNPLQEKVSQNARNYFTYTSPKQQELAICIFEQNQILRFRIKDSNRNDLRWFELKYADVLEKLIDMLIQKQDEVALSNYFGLYGEFSELCNTALLAWEQWE